MDAGCIYCQKGETHQVHAHETREGKIEQHVAGGGRSPARENKPRREDDEKPPRK